MRVCAPKLIINMNKEVARLQTFIAWPTNAPVEASRIAKGGFYATGTGTETQCHWCGVKINDWSYGDQVMIKHRHISPDCAFVVNPNSSGNIPISSSSSSDVATVDLMNEQCRLATFHNWPIAFIPPETLAKAGFYYLNETDHVCCAWCQGVIAKWEVGDDPFTEHVRFFPQCSRAQLGPNVELQSVAPIRSLGIQPIATPKREKYSSLDARIRSFGDWPSDEIQSAEVLASAGFYYQNIDDQVMCFQCSGGLRSWQREDDAWFEHARWFPTCEFVQLVKGQQYIDQVQQQQRPSLAEVMGSDIVKKALELGLSHENIRAVTKYQLDNFSRPFRSTEELVNAVLERDEMHIDECVVASATSDDANAGPPVRKTSMKTTSIACGIAPINNCSSKVNVSKADESTTNSSGESSTKDQATGKSTTKTSNANRNMTLEEENRQLKDARLCKVCMDEDVAVVFLPCGHLVTCVQCAPSVTACPLCRTAIKAFVRTFIS